MIYIYNGSGNSHAQTTDLNEKTSFSRKISAKLKRYKQQRLERKNAKKNIQVTLKIAEYFLYRNTHINTILIQRTHNGQSYDAAYNTKWKDNMTRKTGFCGQLSRVVFHSVAWQKGEGTRRNKLLHAV